MPDIKTNGSDRAVCVGCQEMAARMEVAMDEGVSRKEVCACSGDLNRCTAVLGGVSGDVNSPLHCSDSGFANVRPPEATGVSPPRSSSACRSSLGHNRRLCHFGELEVGLFFLLELLLNRCFHQRRQLPRSGPCADIACGAAARQTCRR